MHIVAHCTGVCTVYSQFAAAPNGDYIVLKKNSDHFCLQRPHSVDEDVVLALSVVDVLHRNDSIFDFAFLPDGRFLVFLQSDQRLHFGFGAIDLDQNTVTVDQLLKEDIPVKTKHGQTQLVRDDLGPVLCSFPHHFQDQNTENRTISLFHVGTFLETGFDQVRTVKIDRRIGVNELWCNPFLSRNCLYFFNQLGPELLQISGLASESRGFAAKLVRTHGSAPGRERPSQHFFHRSILVHRDFALVFFSQHVGLYSVQKAGKKAKKGAFDKPTPVWRLWLNSFMWEPLDCGSGIHWPASKVAICSVHNLQSLFVHGQCAHMNCLEKFHLLQLDNSDGSSNESDVNGNVTDSQPEIVLRKYQKAANGTNQGSWGLKYKRNNTVRPRAESCHSLVLGCAPKPRRHSSMSRKTIFGLRTDDDALEDDCDDMEYLPSTSNSQSELNWSSQMALQGGRQRLSEQLRHAKEMGFTDAEVWAALELNNQQRRDRSFEPFHSTETMVDLLSAVQKRRPGSPAGLHAASSRFPSAQRLHADEKADAEPAKSLPRRFSWLSAATPLAPQTAPAAHRSASTGAAGAAPPGVNRSLSFNDSHALRRSYTAAALHPHAFALHASAAGVKPAQARSSVQRLIDTFENENRRHFEEFQRINQELKRKLENSVHQEETLRELLRLRQEKIRQQDILLKDQNELEKRLENANSRIQDIADIARQQGDYEVLQRRHEAEMRKAEEVKNSLNAEIARLVRENERQVQLVRQIEELKDQVQLKDDQLRNLRDQPNLELDRLTAELARLSEENRELEERQTQGPVCGVCMDSRREVIFMPCLHFTCCKNCADAMIHCSICRLRIMGKIEFFQ